MWLLTLLLASAFASGTVGDRARMEEVAMHAPRMPEVTEMAGRWIYARPTGDRCSLELGVAPAPLTAGSLAAPMWQARVTPGCPALERVRGWRPAPGGIHLADADGMELASFMGGPAGPLASDREGPGVRLERGQ